MGRKGAQAWPEHTFPSTGRLLRGQGVREPVGPVANPGLPRPEGQLWAAPPSLRRSRKHGPCVARSSEVAGEARNVGFYVKSPDLSLWLKHWKTLCKPNKTWGWTWPGSHPGGQFAAGLRGTCTRALACGLVSAAQRGAWGLLGTPREGRVHPQGKGGVWGSWGRGALSRVRKKGVTVYHRPTRPTVLCALFLPAAPLCQVPVVLSC